MTRPIGILACTLCAQLLIPDATNADAPRLTVAATQQFLGDYCTACHNDGQRAGKLSFDAFDEGQWQDYGLLDAVAEQLDGGAMPPDYAKRGLPDAERASFLASLSDRLEELTVHQLPGTYTKLTATEYNHTLIDLFGESLRAPDALPPDAEGDFKKVGETQVITSYAVDKYFEVARDYLDHVILVEASMPKTIRWTTDDSRRYPRRWRTGAGAHATLGAGHAGR